MTLRRRTFSRLVEAGNLLAAITDVDADVNTFLGTLDFNDVATVETSIDAGSKYNERILYLVVVTYLE